MEKRDNSGTLSRNDKKELDTQPDFKGKATVDGVDYWISGWIKESQYGKYFSLSFKRKDDAQARKAKADDLRGAARGEPRRSTAEDIDDSVPF